MAFSILNYVKFDSKPMETSINSLPNSHLWYTRQQGRRASNIANMLSPFFPQLFICGCVLKFKTCQGLMAGAVGIYLMVFFFERRDFGNFHRFSDKVGGRFDCAI